MTEQQIQQEYNLRCKPFIEQKCRILALSKIKFVDGKIEHELTNEAKEALDKIDEIIFYFNADATQQMFNVSRKKAMRFIDMPPQHGRSMEIQRNIMESI